MPLFTESVMRSVRSASFWSASSWVCSPEATSSSRWVLAWATMASITVCTSTPLSAATWAMVLPPWSSVRSSSAVMPRAVAAASRPGPPRPMPASVTGAALRHGVLQGGGHLVGLLLGEGAVGHQRRQRIGDVGARVGPGGVGRSSSRRPRSCWWTARPTRRGRPRRGRRRRLRRALRRGRERRTCWSSSSERVLLSGGSAVPRVGTRSPCRPEVRAGRPEGEAGEGSLAGS